MYCAFASPSFSDINWEHFICTLLLVLTDFNFAGHAVALALELFNS